MHILWCLDSKLCGKFQRCPLKFNAKFWTHAQQNMHFGLDCNCLMMTHVLKGILAVFILRGVKKLTNYDILSLSEKGPWHDCVCGVRYADISGNNIGDINSLAPRRCSWHKSKINHLKIIRINIVQNFMWNYPQVNFARHHWWLINLGSSNCLVPSGNTTINPFLPSDAIWRQ